MARLTYAQRKALPKSAFVFPNKAPGPGSYPIPDASHRRAALQRSSQFGSSAVKSAVRRKVHQRQPSMAINALKD